MMQARTDLYSASVHFLNPSHSQIIATSTCSFEPEETCTLFLKAKDVVQACHSCQDYGMNLYIS